MSGYATKDEEVLCRMRAHLETAPAPVMPPTHAAEPDITAVGERAGGLPPWKAAQVFHGLVREGALLRLAAPSNEVVEAAASREPHDQYERDIRDVIAEHGRSMDGPTWYATTQYLDQLRENARVGMSPELKRRRMDELSKIADVGRDSPEGSVGQARWQAFLDRCGFTYD